MLKIEDLVAALLVIDFKGMICNISSPLFTGEFVVKRVFVKNDKDLLKPNLIMDTNVGALTLNLDRSIKKIDELYKWGYIIPVESIDNKPMENCFIELSKKKY